MKLTILATLFAAITVHANPKVGTFAKYDTVLSKGDKQVVAAISLELVRYDAAAKKYTQKVTFERAGAAPQIEEVQVEEANLLTPAVVASILTDCVKEGGKLEKLTTPAGQIDTCALTYDDAEEAGTVWIGRSAYGIVKQDSLDKAAGVRTVMTLNTSRP